MPSAGRDCTHKRTDRARDVVEHSAENGDAGRFKERLRGGLLTKTASSHAGMRSPHPAEIEAVNGISDTCTRSK